MPYNPFNAPLSLEIKPSLQKYFIISTPHIFALILLISITKLSLLFLFILVITVLLSLVHFLRLHYFCSSDHSVISIQQDSADNWTLILAHKNEMKTVSFMPSSYVSNRLIILIYKDDNAHRFYKNHSILITKDSIPKQKFRILKTKLKLHRLN